MTGAPSLADLLFAPAVPVDPDGPVLHVGDETHTWATLRSRAEAIAADLHADGVGPGRSVGVMLPNGAELVATLFGVWRAGGVYVPLNPRLGADDLAHALDAAGPTVIVPAAGSGAPAPEPAARKRFAPDAALVQFTSGTTGRPRPVVLTHPGVLTLLDGVIAKLRGGGRPAGRRAPMPNLIPVSLSLWAGIYNVLFALRVGAPVVVMDGFDPVELGRLVARHGIRSTVLPPAAMVALVDDPRVGDLAPLRFVRSITAPLSPHQARRFRDRFGIAVLNSYGQTEIGGEIVGWNAADTRDWGDAKLGSVGRPHAGVELRTGASGELEVRTPALAAAYADGSDLGDRLTADGWFRTGDVARIDADGFVWIEGRVSDMINRGGLKVHPGEVEEVLLSAPEVADVAVVGIPDDRLGEVPCAFVVPRDPGLAPTSDGLSGLCRAHLAPYKVPVRFEVVDALPRNEVGKVQRALLKGSGT